MTTCERKSSTRTSISIIGRSEKRGGAQVAVRELVARMTTHATNKCEKMSLLGTMLRLAGEMAQDAVTAQATTKLRSCYDDPPITIEGPEKSIIATK